ILWVGYHLSPGGLEKTIWPSGFVSAVAGALTVSMTFLLWLELSFTKTQSTLIAAVTGFIPSIWYHSLIGEVYSLQLCCTVALGLFFVRGNLLLATLVFLAAILVTPVSVLSGTMMLLAYHRNHCLREAVVVGLLSCVAYFGVCWIVNPGIVDTVSLVNSEPGQGSKDIAGSIVRLLLIWAINLHVMIPAFLMGSAWLAARHRELAAKLLWVVLPQLALIVLSPQFFIELGSFQLPMFWIMAVPIGLYLAHTNSVRSIAFQIAASIIITMCVWILPNTRAGAGYEQAGWWLRSREAGEVSIVGSWQGGLHVAVIKNDWDVRKAESHLTLYRPGRTEKELEDLGKNRLMIVETKENLLRRSVSFLPGLGIAKWDPTQNFKRSQVEKIFENEYIRIYLWKRDHEVPALGAEMTGGTVERPLRVTEEQVYSLAE
ncbi:MAG: hypothetical protein ACREX4_14410, partial [Gammaproteobacteria bacterium]